MVSQNINILVANNMPKKTHGKQKNNMNINSYLGKKKRSAHKV
jgi:hypothetical protein